MWKMLLNLLIDFLLSLVRDKGIKEKDKIEVVVKPAPVLVPVNPNIVIPVEKGTVKPLLIEKFLPKTQYCPEVTDKDVIVIHHTVGSDSSSSYAYWLGSKERVATHFLVDRDGGILQCMDTKYWAYHIYINSPGNRIPKEYKKLGSEYDMRSVGIELCALGQVTLKNGVFYDVYKRAISADRVVKLDKPYKQFLYWEKYTEKQLESLEYLILTLCERYPKIKEKAKLQITYSDISEISQDALEFKRGIVSHANWRTDKYDTAPQPDLIKLLESIHTKL